MSDYRFDITAPIRALERGRMGAGDHPLSNGLLARALGTLKREATGVGGIGTIVGGSRRMPEIMADEVDRAKRIKKNVKRGKRERKTRD